MAGDKTQRQAKGSAAAGTHDRNQAAVQGDAPAAPVSSAGSSAGRVLSSDADFTPLPYLQNRELSWLTFNERVLDQGSDETVPLLERLNFISIFSSNLQEFFMVRVGSLTDLNLIKKTIRDNKTMMTPAEQLEAIYARCHELYPVQEAAFETVRGLLSEQGVSHLRIDDLDDNQAAFLRTHMAKNVIPLLSPQIINTRHPFPHLENGALYVVVRLDETDALAKDAESKVEKAADGGSGKNEGGSTAKSEKKAKNVAAEGVTLGIIPMPRYHSRIIEVPSGDDGFSFVLIEDAIESAVPDIFDMYFVKHTNIICVTRNADLDATEGTDEIEEDYREHMKKILKKRTHLAPVRLESRKKLSQTVSSFLLKRLNLRKSQVFVTSVPFDMGYTYGIAAHLPDDLKAELTNTPFAPQWPAMLDRNRPTIDQVFEREVLLSYPYECMDAFVQLLREAANDPSVISIKITLYRLARQSHLAEALIAAAENGKDVTALFELRARFDESNNIEWSQRFEQAGAKVIYGFRDHKVHSKVCCITMQHEGKVRHITQLGTGNYNEKTASLYTDLSFITTDETVGRDAVEFFKNMGLENISDNYEILWVAPLQIKQMICSNIDQEIAKAEKGEPAGLFFKTNSITDKDIIEKIVEASQAGVPTTLLARGISCIVPGVEGYTDQVKVFSIVGRLLEHSRIYGFGAHDSMRIYLSSADLMTRNMDKRIEIAWPMLNEGLRQEVVDYIDRSLSDTAKRRELLPDGSYTPLGFFAEDDGQGGKVLVDSQEYFIAHAQEMRLAAAQEEAARAANRKAGPVLEGATDAQGAAVSAESAVKGSADLEEAARSVGMTGSEEGASNEPASTETGIVLLKKKPFGRLRAYFKRLFGRR